MSCKFVKGSKVEVMSKKGVPLGAWHCAEIISGNGHYYCVKYDRYSSEVGSAVEKVARKDMRPCPPPVAGFRSWVPGDIVEVLEDGCWKPAQVLKVVDGVSVRLIGSSREFRARRSGVRLRQSWKDNTWALIGRESVESYDGMAGDLSKVEKFKFGLSQPCTEVTRHKGNDHFLSETDRCFEEPYQLSSRDMKKRKRASYHAETYTRADREIETQSEQRKSRRLVAGQSFQVAKKVDAVASPKITFGEKYMHNSFKNGPTKFPELGMYRGNPYDDDVVHFTVGSLENGDCESFSSSVGSSSPSYSPFRSKVHSKSSPTETLTAHLENVGIPSRSRESNQPRGGLGSEIHQLELNAYRSTLVALYSSGPLNWEREALLTNLRLVLHITNDEHLRELKHLASMKCNST